MLKTDLSKARNKLFKGVSNPVSIYQARFKPTLTPATRERVLSSCTRSRQPRAMLRDTEGLLKIFPLDTGLEAWSVPGPRHSEAGQLPCCLGLQVPPPVLGAAPSPNLPHSEFWLRVWSG